jgi:hypothetical protein
LLRGLSSSSLVGSCLQELRAMAGDAFFSAAHTEPLATKGAGDV